MPKTIDFINIAETCDTKSVNTTVSESSKNAEEVVSSDAEIQLLKEDSEKQDLTVFEDSDFSETDSESGSYVQSVTVNEAKGDEDLIKEPKDEIDEDDSIGLKLRPSWQMKNPQNTLTVIDEKHTSL